MDSINSITFKVIILGAGLFFVKKALDTQKRIRQIQDTPRSKSQTAAQGLTEFEGFAWPTEKSETTTRQQEAVYHTIELQKERSTGSGDNRRTEWVTVSKHEFTPSFYLCDGTGLILIHPQNAQFEMLIEETRSWRSLGSGERDFAMMILPNPDGFLDMPSSGFLGGLFAGNYRIIEKALLVGSPLYVSGDFKTHGSELQTVQAAGLTRFYEMIYDPQTKSLKNLKSILDKNNDGKVSRQESLEGFSVAARLAVQKSKIEKLTEKEFTVYGQLAQSETHQLFIAGAHENDLVKNMRFKPALMLVGGAAAAALAVVLLIQQIDLSQSWTKHREPTSQSVAKTHAAIGDATQLHTECIANHLSSCVQLIERQKDLDLAPIHINYYKSKACQLGEARYCN